MKLSKVKVIEGVSNPATPLGHPADEFRTQNGFTIDLDSATQLVAVTHVATGNSILIHVSNTRYMVPEKATAEKAKAK